MFYHDAQKGKRRFHSGRESNLRSPKGDLSLTGFTEDLTSPRVVKKILAEHQLRLKKRFGQNFLVDRNILNKILESAELKKNDLVVEIGGGIGTLTQEIASKVEKVWTIEIDRGLVNILKKTLKVFPNIKILHVDALKINLSQLIFKETGFKIKGLLSRIKVIGNIPYSLTTPLVRKLLEDEPEVSKAWLLLPEDVVKRIKALPGSKAYGAFSVLVNFYANVQAIRKIPPQVFFPIPKVASILVKLERHKEGPRPKDKNLFFEVVRASFKTRRKKLSNAIKPLLEKRKLKFSDVKKNTEIDLNRRGETLSLKEFLGLADYLATRRIYGEN